MTRDSWPWTDSEILISYATADGGRGPLAELLHSRLGALGSEPRLDKLDIDEGRQWRGEINGWLDTCELAIVLATHEAFKSEWVKYEVYVLAQRNRRPATDLDAVLIARLNGVTIDDVNMAWGKVAQACETQMRHDYVGLTDEQVANEIIENLRDLGTSGKHRLDPPLASRARIAKTILPASGSYDVAATNLGISPQRWNRCTNDDKRRGLVATQWCRAAKVGDAITTLKKAIALDEDRGDLVDLHLASFFSSAHCNELARVVGIAPPSGHEPPTAVVLHTSEVVSAELAVRSALTISTNLDLRGIRTVNVNAWPEEDDAASTVADLAMAEIHAAYDGEVALSDLKDQLAFERDERGRVPWIVIVRVAADHLQPADLQVLVERAPSVGWLFVGPNPTNLGIQLGLPVLGHATDDHSAMHADQALAEADGLPTTRKRYRAMFK